MKACQPLLDRVLRQTQGESTERRGHKATPPQSVSALLPAYDLTKLPVCPFGLTVSRNYLKNPGSVESTDMQKEPLHILKPHEIFTLKSLLYR